MGWKAFLRSRSTTAVTSKLGKTAPTDSIIESLRKNSGVDRVEKVDEVERNGGKLHYTCVPADGQNRASNQGYIRMDAPEFDQDSL
jgi:hypothetical protein